MVPDPDHTRKGSSVDGYIAAFELEYQEHADDSIDTDKEFNVTGRNEQGEEITIDHRAEATFNIQTGITTWYIQFSWSKDGIRGPGTVTHEYFYYDVELKVDGLRFYWPLGQKMDKPFIVSPIQKHGTDSFVCFIGFTTEDLIENSLSYYFEYGFPGPDFEMVEYKTEKAFHDKILTTFFREEDNIKEAEIVKRNCDCFTTIKYNEENDNQKDYVLNRELKRYQNSQYYFHETEKIRTTKTFNNLKQSPTWIKGLHVRFKLKDPERDGWIAAGGADFLKHNIAEGTIAEGKAVYRSLAGEGTRIPRHG